MTETAKMTILNVIGTGGFAHQLLPMIRRGIASAEFSDVRFVDESDNEEPFLGFKRFDIAGLSGGECFVVAIARGEVRKRLAERLNVMGLEAATLISEYALVSADATVASGAIVCDNTIIEPAVQIGKHFHCNIYSYVAHDCKIGDYVTFAPRVSCNGNVHIDDHAYIGTAAILRQGTSGRPLRIGRGAIVGMGAVVTKDVPNGQTVIGNPAIPLQH